MTNIVEFPGRATANMSDKDIAEKDRILRQATALRKMPRIPLEDRPILAANLGKLAQRVNPGNPLKGAREMFKDRAASKWDKRKRLLRLPRKADSNTADRNDYEGGGQFYVLLAEEAGRLLAGTSDPRALERSRRDALRYLMAGTSFLPAFLPASKGERDVVDLLQRVSETLARKVLAHTQIEAFWRLLDRTPIEFASLDEGAHASLVDALGRNRANDWTCPAVRLGSVARSMPARVFVLPQEWAAGIEQTPGAAASSELVAWLEARGATSEQLPDVAWSEETGWGWRQMDLSVVHAVDLVLAPEAAGGAGLRLEVYGEDGLYPTFVGSGEMLVAEMLARDAHEEVCHDLWIGELPVKALWQPAWAAEDRRSRLLGLFDNWSDYSLQPACGVIAEGWVEDRLIGDVLLSPGFTFHPAIEAPDDSDKAVPCHTRSAAAAILRNLEAADARIDHLLIRHADLIARAGLGHHDRLIDHYKDVLGRLMEEN